ncbi:MAG TPA: hypothetical protein VFE62_03065 [Gemmataceae bacterium]|nr:hypothetical protein [Gemmataceae bacterium]
MSNIKYNVKTKIDGKYQTFGNIQEGERGMRLGMKATAALKKMVADAPEDTYLNWLIFPNDRQGDGQ